MGRVTVAFLWHMHQPFYVDLAGGRATLPWVRLHGLKDYYDLPSHARRFPGVKHTFNLVPSLVDQLEAYTEGRLTDPFLEAASRPARELTREDRLFLLREFFSYHPPTMAENLPRLEALRMRRGARPPEAGDDATFAAWRETDYRDLQVLFHLAWSGPELARGEVVSRLIAKESGFSQEDLEDLLREQREFLRRIVPEYRAAVGEGTIEISASPYYHPILPLLCDTGSAREASHGLPLPSAPFSHPGDAALQVRLALEAFERRFGARPSGMWPSEGALSNASLGILAAEGVRWAASDEDMLFAALESPPRDFGDRSYRLHRPYAGPDGTILFFRDHVLSDRIGFVYSSWDPQAAADDFLGRLAAVGDASGGEERVVAVILDGENAWEYYSGNGEPFFSALLSRLSASTSIRTRTFGEIAEECRRGGIEPAPIPRLRAGSWIRSDLTTWIGHETKNRAWSLLSETRAALGPPAAGTPAGDSLLAAEGSDWFWWFGDEHSSAHDEDFDRTFRAHLRNAYVLAGREAPGSLAHPVSPPLSARPFPLPMGPLNVTLDGRATDYFEWLPAGRVLGDLGQGTMSRGGRILASVQYGLDGGRLALRLDTTASHACERLEGLVVVVEVESPVPMRHRVPLRRGPIAAGPILGCLETILEILVPIGDGRVAGGTPFVFRIFIEDAGGRPLEGLPSDGFISFESASGEADWAV